MTADTWEPGIPLYVRAAYRDYLSNFRDEDEPHAEPGPDAAWWPIPINGRGLSDDHDEISEFIHRWHVWRREAGYQEEESA